MIAGGMPMSAITTSPAWSSAGGSTSGILGEASVTVIDACTAWPTTCDVSAERPLGRSIDTTGTSSVLRSATTVSSSPASGGLSPVPTIASMTRPQPPTSDECSSHDWSSATSTASTPSRPRMSRFSRASPVTLATGPRTNTDTSTPRWARVRATTKPSPPLLPRPHSTAMRRLSRSS